MTPQEAKELRDSFAEEKAAEILESMEKAMNEETPKQSAPASYGEPWMHAPTWDILQTSEGKCIPYDAHHMAEPYLSRAIQCVNACAGIADPEKAIQAAREALTKLRNASIFADAGGEGHYSIAAQLKDYEPELLAEVDAALAQLNHTK